MESWVGESSVEAGWIAKKKLQLVESWVEVEDPGESSVEAGWIAKRKLQLVESWVEVEDPGESSVEAWVDCQEAAAGGILGGG